MLQKIVNYFVNCDERGDITGIINTGEWREINIINSNAGSRRGAHYHKIAMELFYIIQGEIDVTIHRVEDGVMVGLIERLTVYGGDTFIIFPYVNHTFDVKVKAQWINALSHRHDQNEPDLHRIQASTV